MRRLLLPIAFLLACGAGDASTSDDALSQPAAHRAFPQIPANDGDVLAHPRLVTIVSPDDDLASDLFAYSDALVHSAWWKKVASEYGVSGFAPGGSVVGAKAIASDATNAEVDAYVSAAVQSNPSLAPDGRTIYLVYFPSDGGACGSGGSHHRFGQLGDAVARVHRCVDKIPWIASHEIVEAATNPTGHGYVLRPASPIWTGSVWSARDGEVGDLCESEPPAVEGAYAFERSYSNAAAAHGKNPCVPADAGSFFDVSVAHDWYPVAAGSSVSVKVTGWSSAKRSAWSLAAKIVPRKGDGTGAGFTATLSDDTIKNGATVTLTVSAGDITPGQWALVELRSVGPAADGVTMEHHAWPVGFYVPTSSKD